MLYNYKEAINLYGNDYNLKKAISNKDFFKIEKGIYSDGKDNFTLIELVLKKYSHAFLVKDSALYLIGFLNEEPEKSTPSAPKQNAGYSLSELANKKTNGNDSWICKECGTKNDAGNLYCKDCGKYK